MTITEPSTMITDYLLTLVALAAAVRLSQKNRTGRSVRFWSGALVFTGLAAAAGGTYHGFQTVMSPSLAPAVWKTTMACIGLASFCFAGGAIFAVFAGGWRKVLLAVVTAKLAVYLVWLIGHDDFRYAVYDYTPAMVGVLLILLYAWNARREPAARWIITGILVSFGASLIQIVGVGIHQHFNHNDIYHVIQMAGIYCFYRGGLYLADRASTS